MRSLNPAMVAGIVGALSALVIMTLVLAKVPPIVIALLVVPAAVGGVVALSVRQLTAWREITQRRAVLLLQAAGALLTGRLITGLSLAALQASGSITASETSDSVRIAIEYALGSRSGVAWDIASALLGLAFIMASVWIARSPNALFHTATSQTASVSTFQLDPAPITQSQLDRARAYKTYDSDLPPRTEYWVGREAELQLARQLQRGVLTITGIGGQGKSYLAAKILEAWRASHPFGFWDWRDCRELGDRVERQLISIIERITAGEIAPHTLTGADSATLTRLFFRLTRGTSGAIVLDNVDHYINVDQGTFISGVDALVRQALRAHTDFLIVLTCRPRISYPDITFREVPLRGLSLEETGALFHVKRADLRNLPDPAATIARIHAHTRGHPFWLNVIATQIQRMPHKSAEILEELTAPTDNDQLVAMLRPVWHGLNENQKHILHIMSELPKAEHRERLELYALTEIPSANQFSRAFRGLDALGLVVRKEEADLETRYEIHPVVRQFINQEFPSARQRIPYMKAILLGCNEYIGRVIDSEKRNTIASVETLEYAAIAAEMQLRSGETMEGIKSIGEIHDPFIAKGLAQEILRLAESAFADIDWDDPRIRDTPEFHSFVTDIVVTLIENSREASARQLIARYAAVVMRGTATYVSWCATMSQCEWMLGRHEEAIAWGREGHILKETSKMDTQADARQYLNLALRDSGRVEEAFAYFLGGNSVADVLEMDHRTAQRGAPFYGNIGRCLYLLGRFRDATLCYARSADLLYDEIEMNPILNQGWAGLWIGDVCLKESRSDLAVLFYHDCKNVWSVRAPLLLQNLERSLAGAPDAVSSKVSSIDVDVRLQCRAQVREWLSSP